MSRNFNSDGSAANNGFSLDEVPHNKRKRNSDHETSARIEISRLVYNQQDLHDEMIYNKKSKPSPQPRDDLEVKSFLLKTFPFFPMIFTYKLEYLVGDIISGAMVCSTHISGMGHALVANLPPVVGIYMGFWPALLYGLFASSRHNSIGAFAVMAIMTEKIVVKYATPILELENNATGPSQPSIDYGYSPVEVASLLCFLVGVFQLLMYVLRLGGVALPDCILKGLTAGAAFQIFSSQAKEFVGVTLPPVGGYLGDYFKIIKNYVETFKHVESFNYTTLTIFIVACALLLFNELLKVKVLKKMKFPIPMELIVIVLSMLLSKIFDVEANWNVHLVGNIPGGLPTPTFPKLDLWRKLLMDAGPIAMISYSVSMSLASKFAQKSGYGIDSNQELLAMGSANIAGSFFSCFPVSAALARSTLQFQLGGRTQVASIVNVALILCILLWIAPLFELIPRTVLAAIVVVGLKGLMMQVFDLKKLWDRSKIDGVVFVLTFLTVLIVSIDIAVIVALFVSSNAILFMSLKPHVCLLGHIPSTDLYLDIEKFEKAIEIPFVKIFHYSGSITILTKSVFKNQLCKKLKINILKELKKQKNETAETTESVERCEVARWDFNNLVLDFSAISYIDEPSVDMLNSLIKDFIKLNIKVLIAGCSTKIFEALKRRGHFEFMEILHPTIHDAIKSQKI